MHLGSSCEEEGAAKGFLLVMKSSIVRRRKCLTSAFLRALLTSLWAPQPLGTNLGMQLILGPGKGTPKCVRVDYTALPFTDENKLNDFQHKTLQN